MDNFSKVADFYVWAEPDPSQDPRGNPLPPVRRYLHQDADVDLQPRSGTERVMRSGTFYASTHVMFAGPDVTGVGTGVFVDVKEMCGSVVQQTFKVVFAADWGTHFVFDLEAV